MAKVAIIVPTASTERYPASKCLEVARATTKHLDASIHPIVSSGAGFSFSKSINRGLREAPDADAWILLNDDAFMDEGWVEAMLKAVDDHPNVGLVGAVLRYPEDRPGIQHAGGRIYLTPGEYFGRALETKAPLWAMRNIAKRRFGPHPYMTGHYHDVSPRNRLDYLTGACLLITRRLRDRIGDLREEYVFGSEDADYGLRCLEAGMELCLATKATGVHLETATSGHLAPKAKASYERFGQTWSGRRVKELTRGRVGVYA